MQIINSLVDELALINVQLNNVDLKFHVHNGPGYDFKEIVIVVCAHESPISFEELHKKLIDYETFLKREAKTSENPSITTNFANNMVRTVAVV